MLAIVPFPTKSMLLSVKFQSFSTAFVPADKIRELVAACKVRSLLLSTVMTTIFSDKPAVISNSLTNAIVASLFTKI